MGLLIKFYTAWGALKLTYVLSEWHAAHCQAILSDTSPHYQHRSTLVSLHADVLRTCSWFPSQFTLSFTCGDVWCSGHNTLRMFKLKGLSILSLSQSNIGQPQLLARRLGCWGKCPMPKEYCTQALYQVKHPYTILAASATCPSSCTLYTQCQINWESICGPSL